jgi:hypothetical protein
MKPRRPTDEQEVSAAKNLQLDDKERLKKTTRRSTEREPTTFPWGEELVQLVNL